MLCLRSFVESETVILPFMVLDQKATYYLRFELVCSFDYLFPVDICKSALKRNLLHVKQDWFIIPNKRKVEGGHQYEPSISILCRRVEWIGDSQLGDCWGPSHPPHTHLLQCSPLPGELSHHHWRGLRLLGERRKFNLEDHDFWASHI